MRKDVVVLGSINMDLVANVLKVPEDGETISGLSFKTYPGGKGANQAVAIARQGGRVSMIGRIGSDVFGEELVEILKSENVNINYIDAQKAQSSGIALILVDKFGHNRIIVVPGANGSLTEKIIKGSESLIESGGFLVTQLEIPVNTVKYAVKIAKSKQVKTILNYSPVPSGGIDEDFIRQIDFLVVNEIEASDISGKKVNDVGSAVSAARSLQKRTEGCVIITLGEMGSVTAIEDDVWHTKAFNVNPKDTTAAGDAFIGGLVVALVNGKNLKDAIIYANAAGALATCKLGAQPSLPTYEEIINFTKARLRQTR